MLAARHRAARDNFLPTLAAVAADLAPFAEGRPAFLRPRFVDGEIAPFEVFAVQSANRRLGFAVRRHFDKAKSFGSAGKLIDDDARRLHTAMGGKQIF